MTKKTTNIRAGRDAVGRDQKISASRGGVVIGGDVTGSNIVAGNNNVVGNVTNITNVFQEIYRKVEETNLPTQEKEDLTAMVKEVEEEVKKGDQADETFLARQLRNIQRMAPEILEVIVTTFTNPAAGLGLVARRIAERMKAEAKPA
jgi:hypothetical protein